MAEVLLFHHALGLTAGCMAFAEELRAGGHAVHTPDLYQGRVFDNLDEGVAYAKQVGFGTILDRGVHAADQLPADMVYAGFSLGVMPAQKLAQTRPGAKGALLFSGCFPPEEFGSWPAELPAEIHMMDGDPWVLEGDLDAARQLAAANRQVELFLYPGKGHLFADSSSSDYDPASARLLRDRVLAFLKAVS